MATSLTKGRGRAVRVGIVAAMVAASLISITGPSLAGALQCNGKTVTLSGTEANDTLVGTEGVDVIHGLGGDDHIRGLDSNDTICGGDGDDVIYGGKRADTIFGGAGDDTISGGSGRDELSGGSGNDTLNGGSASDELRGGPDVDILSGGAGADDLYGNGGADELYGGGNDDYLSGGPGGDLLVAMVGNDQAAGNAGADTIHGNEGDDTLVGGAGIDVVDGGAGGGDLCMGDTVIACESQPVDFEFERFLINQAVPAADSSQDASDRVGTVRNRAGIARAFISADRPGLASPTVHLYYKINGTVGKVRMTGPETLPEDPLESDLTTTFNYVFDESFLEPGAKIYVVVDRGNVTLEASESNNRYPGSGWVDIDTRDVPTLKITVVPVDGVSLNQAQAEELFEKVMKVHPVADYDIEIGAPFDCYPGVCTRDFLPRQEDGTPTDWERLLVYLRGQQENPSNNPDNRMYHGIVPQSWRDASGVAGVAYIGLPVALTSRGYREEETVAHEVGHNLELLHNPCPGFEAETDPGFPFDTGFPYENGSIGHWGYDAATGDTYSPGAWVDLMTYCQPEWISDFSYNKVLDYRSAAYGYDVQADGLAPTGTGTVVQFSGSVPANARAVANFEAVPEDKRINGLPVTKISSIEVVDHRAVPPSPGDNRLVGRDEQGAEVVAVSFRAYAMDHAPGAHFLFSVEIAPEDLASIVIWEVEKSGKVLTSLAAG